MFGHLDEENVYSIALTVTVLKRPKDELIFTYRIRPLNSSIISKMQDHVPYPLLCEISSLYVTKKHSNTSYTC